MNWLSGAGPDQLDPEDERLQLAFRELKKIKPGDLDRLMRALAALRGPKEKMIVANVDLAQEALDKKFGSS